MAKKIKYRKCKICRENFIPHPSMFLPPTCEKMDCRIEYSNKHLTKKVKQVKKQAYREKKKFNWNDKTWLKATAQEDINKYARLRDRYENGHRCCTCPEKRLTRKMDGGHFLPTSGYSAIRYNTNQIHQQCVNCNRHNGGRREEYTEFMINKYGKEYTDSLKATKNELRSYSIEYYQKLIKVVRKKIKKVKSKLKDVE